MEAIIIVPSIFFLIFVAPIWLIMHYRHKSKAVRGLGEQEQKDLDELLATIDQLTERVATLEKILDIKHASWREQETNTREEHA